MTKLQDDDVEMETATGVRRVQLPLDDDADAADDYGDCVDDDDDEDDDDEEEEEEDCDDDVDDEEEEGDGCPSSSLKSQY